MNWKSRIASLAQLRIIALAAIVAWSASVSAAAEQATTLGIDGSRFTLNGKPTFLLGWSYYGALGASEEFMRQDFDDAQRYGFNWLRVWVTWESFGNDVSAVDAQGQSRQPFMDKLNWLVAECDRRGLVVDLTFTRGNGNPGAISTGRLPDFAAHQRAVETVVDALKAHRNWYLDLANERDVGDARYVPLGELKSLRELVRRLDPSRLVTASFGGHDLSDSDVRDALLATGLDFLCPHRPRDPRSPSQTEARTRECFALMRQIGRIVPVHHQEPFRRGYTAWEPSAEDFLTDLRGAIAGGAAGWCFHNGSQNGTSDKEPRRSFDLRAKRLFDQLDAEELKVFRDAATRQPLFRVVDLNVGEFQEIELSDGSKANVKLIGVEESRDTLRAAIRLARVKVEVNGVVTTIESGNYRLPVTVGGVQIDCPATLGLYLRRDLFEDSWGLDKDARLRLWPKESPWVESGSFGYPIKQRWFGNVTQAGNEPSYVMGEDAPTSRNIYYHAGNDIGGVEGLDQVVSACDGLVISTAGKTLAAYPDLPFYQQSSYATVYVLDAHGWIYRYTHLKSIDPSVRLGERIKIGQNVGRLGKEEGAGYYAHLHFDIKSRKPSGKWGVEDAYAFLWEAYQREYKPAIIAVARPHILTRTGEPVMLDGSRSWTASGKITRYEWILGDGASEIGSTIQRQYDNPGRYSEILKVTDSEGHVSYDFAIVDVVERGRGDKASAGIHAAYYPSLNIRPGDEVTFVVRTAGTIPSGETWDFGDGNPPVKVRSDASLGSGGGYAETVHAFAKAGHYLVRVEHTTETGAVITMRLDVLVE